jgi:hypothetical protein
MKYFYIAYDSLEKSMKLLMLHRLMKDDSLVGHNGGCAVHTTGSITALFR